MTSASSFSDQTHSHSVLRIPTGQIHTSRRGESVPVMQETLLLLELEAQEFCIDLRTLSQLVLNDLGATLQVLRLAGREYGDVGGRPVRVEDCIADRGVQACLDAMSAQLIPHGERSQAIADVWTHSREIARHAKHIAEQTMDLDPDQAYLVGLCHSIGALPEVLGWSGCRRQGIDRVRAGLELAREWSLPGFVVDYFFEMQRCEGSSSLTDVVREAHRCAGRPSDVCVSGMDLQPHLLRAV